MTVRISLLGSYGQGPGVHQWRGSIHQRRGSIHQRRGSIHMAKARVGGSRGVDSGPRGGYYVAPERAVAVAHGKADRHCGHH
eukprot:1193072-Prorocentrum_minimum.AAC.2